MKGLLRVLALSAVLWTPLAIAPQASAESIAEALAAAYEGNPTLRAERARQRQDDEAVPQALAGWRPQVDAQAQMQYQNEKTYSGSSTGPAQETINYDAQIGLAQPIFRGFRTVEGVARAEANVRAGRQNLLAVEQQVLFNTVQAYMNVWRDRRIVTYRERNVAVLREQLNAAQTRFSVGEVTRTDVAQARSRLALAQANLATARFNLAASIANYARIVGHPPGSLSYPKIAKLPKSLETSIELADRLNPNILSAAFTEDAAVHNVEVERGALYPTVTLNATADYAATDRRGFPVPTNTTQTLVISGTVEVPLYQGGSEYSAIRAAKQLASQQRIKVVEQGRAVREAVTSSWAAVQATYKTIAAGRVQVQAAQIALEGVRQEYLVGSRTTLDVLDAEQELVNARILLVTEERDLIVSAYQVLGSIGKLTAQHLNLNVDYYDVEKYYLKVRNKWFGTDAETVK